MPFSFAHRLFGSTVACWFVALATSASAQDVMPVETPTPTVEDAGASAARKPMLLGPTGEAPFEVELGSDPVGAVEPAEEGTDSIEVEFEIDSLRQALDAVERDDSDYSDDEVTSDLLNDALLRGEIIDAHRPREVGTSHHSILPPIVRVEAQRLRGIAMEALRDDEAARAAFETIIGLGDETADTWQRLGRARLRTGDFDGAEAALLAAYQNHLGSDASNVAAQASA